MGIKDFYKLINKFAKDVNVETNIRELEGCTVAVDVSIFLYKYIKMFQEEWKTYFIHFVCALKKNYIYAIYIFDGNEYPVEKLQMQLKRRNEVKKIVDKNEKLKDILDDVENLYKLKSFKENLQSLLNIDKFEDSTDYNSSESVKKLLNTYIEKYTKRTFSVSLKHILQAKKILKLLGVSFIQADGEAEKLCAQLVLNGQAHIVLSEDTDVLVYGSSLISKFDLNSGKITFLNIQMILDELSMDQNTFKDLCILLSCDYNTRTVLNINDKKIHIGLVKAFELIRKYKSIDNISNIDLTPLNHKKCREIFNTTKDKIKIPVMRNPNFSKVSEYIIKHKLKIHIGYIEELWSPINVIIV